MLNHIMIIRKLHSKQNLNFQLKRGFKKQKYQLTLRKFYTPLLDQPAPQKHHMCPSCQSFKPITVPSHQKTKQYPKTHHYAIIDVIINTKTKIAKCKTKNILLKLVKDHFQNLPIRQRNPVRIIGWSS